SSDTGSSGTMMGNGSAMMGGGSAMMGAGTMMGSGMMGNGMTAEHIAEMPADGAFVMLTQVCSACHTKFRAESQ
ncbi:cytochrome c, partial [Aliiroseovarius sp. KMU-50]|nr:cytochrome c [Aliiroseovarius sp. KMU-50]